MRIGIAVMVAALAIGLTGVAEGKTKRVVTQISIAGLTSTEVHGSISTELKDCRGGRRVVLYRESGTPQHPGLAIPVAGTKTKKNGSWALQVALTPGSYHVVVHVRRKGVLKCLSGVSPSMSI
jgi:hypothetical protein